MKYSMFLMFFLPSIIFAQLDDDTKSYGRTNNPYSKRLSSHFSVGLPPGFSLHVETPIPRTKNSHIGIVGGIVYGEKDNGELKITCELTRFKELVAGKSKDSEKRYLRLGLFFSHQWWYIQNTYTSNYGQPYTQRNESITDGIGGLIGIRICKSNRITYMGDLHLGMGLNRFTDELTEGLVDWDSKAVPVVSLTFGIGFGI